MKKLLFSLLVAVMLLTGGSIFGTSNSIFGVTTVRASVTGPSLREGSQFNVRANAYVRLTSNGAIQPNLVRTGATFTRTSAQAVRIGNFTWVQGRVTGTATQTNGFAGRNIWISTSQLTRLNGGSNIICAINANAYVRNAPNGPNLGLALRGSGFRPTGDSTVHHNGWTWRLGTVTGTNWNNRVLWVATTQFAATSSCR